MLKAQSRLYASQVALGVPARILAVMSASSRVGADEFSRLQRLGNLDGAVAMQAGRLADMDRVAAAITGLQIVE